MYKVETRTDFPNNQLSLVIYVTKCNMKCKYCNWRFMLDSVNRTLKDIDELDTLLDSHKDFIDCITLSGGEPTLDKKLINKVIGYRLPVNLYTNMLLIDDHNINDFNKIYVDVKGSTVEEIMNNTNLNYDKAKKLIELYEYYSTNDKFVWRINEHVSKNKLIEKMKNKIYYKTVKLGD